jgi:hypothetical protein
MLHPANFYSAECYSTECRGAAGPFWKGTIIFNIAIVKCDSVDLKIACGKSYKTFYSCNLRISVISWSVYPWQSFPAKSDVCGQGQEPQRLLAGTNTLAKYEIS